MYCECTPENVLPLEIRRSVYQEYLLSPRVLSFAKGKVIWKYQTRRVHFPSKILEEERYKRLPSPRDVSANSDMRSMTLEQLWLGMVNEFLARSLSPEEDGLPALASIASELNNF
jgi:hypothetical protein